MKKSELRKQSISETLADYILLHGLSSASLRNLAKAAETSDRMLLHYFKDKEALLTSVLSLISERFIQILEHTHTEQMPFSRLIPHLYGALKDPLVRPYLRLWLELAVMASKQEEPFYSIAKQISDRLLEWISQAIQVSGKQGVAQISATVLAIVEGFVLLDALGQESRIMEAIDGIDKMGEA